MKCNECKLPIEDGDYHMKVFQKKRFGASKEVDIHVACITATQGRYLKRTRRD